MCRVLNVLYEPLTEEQILARVDEDGYVEGIIYMNSIALISEEKSFEDNLDIMAERLIGSCRLMDIEWDLVGCCADKDELYFKVRGRVDLEAED